MIRQGLLLKRWSVGSAPGKSKLVLEIRAIQREPITQQDGAVAREGTDEDGALLRVVRVS